LEEQTEQNAGPSGPDQGSPAGLELEVGPWLERCSLRLVAAESCTGGLLGHWLTNVPGSSAYYLGSITAYANEAKEQLLGVRRATLDTYGAVSAEAVIEMARGARSALAGAIPAERLVGVSISGIAGPGGGTLEKPVGTVWIGLSAPEMEQAWHHHWPGDRIANKIFSAEQALRHLLDYLKGRGSNGR
jgi:PncC family amidohydrolase